MNASPHRPAARGAIRIRVAGVGTLSREHSAFLFAEARRQHRPLHVIVDRAIRAGLDRMGVPK